MCTTTCIISPFPAFATRFAQLRSVRDSAGRETARDAFPLFPRPLCLRDASLVFLARTQSSMEVAHTAEIDMAAHAALEGSAKSPRETASSEAPPPATSPGGAGRAHATLGSTPGIDRILSGLGGVEPIASGGKTAAGSPQSGGRSGAPVGHFHFSRGGGNQGM